MSNLCKSKGTVEKIAESSFKYECGKYIEFKLNNGNNDFVIISGFLNNGKISDSCLDKGLNFYNEENLPKVGDFLEVTSKKGINNILNFGIFDENLPYCDNRLFELMGNKDFQIKWGNSCQLSGKIININRELNSSGHYLDTIIQLKNDDGNYYLKTNESFYFGKFGSGLEGGTFIFPKKYNLDGKQKLYYPKVGDNFDIIVNNNTSEILKYGENSDILKCNIKDFPLTYQMNGGLTPMQVVNLNMKKYREYIDLMYGKTETQEQKQENNEFIFGFKFIDYSGGFMISLVMLLLFFTVVLKNYTYKQKLVF